MLENFDPAKEKNKFAKIPEKLNLLSIVKTKEFKFFVI